VTWTLRAVDSGPLMVWFVLSGLVFSTGCWCRRARRGGLGAAHSPGASRASALYGRWAFRSQRRGRRHDLVHCNAGADDGDRLAVANWRATRDRSSGIPALISYEIASLLLRDGRAVPAQASASAMVPTEETWLQGRCSLSLLGMLIPFLSLALTGGHGLRRFLALPSILRRLVPNAPTRGSTCPFSACWAGLTALLSLPWLLRSTGGSGPGNDAEHRQSLAFSRAERSRRPRYVLRLPA